MTNHTVLADRFVTPAIVHSQPVNAAANQLVTADSLSMQYFSHLVHVYQVRAFVCFVVCVCGGGGWSREGDVTARKRKTVQYRVMSGKTDVPS